MGVRPVSFACVFSRYGGLSLVASFTISPKCQTRMLPSSSRLASATAWPLARPPPVMVSTIGVRAPPQSRGPSTLAPTMASPQVSNCPPMPSPSRFGVKVCVASMTPPTAHPTLSVTPCRTIFFTHAQDTPRPVALIVQLNPLTTNNTTRTTRGLRAHSRLH